MKNWLKYSSRFEKILAGLLIATHVLVYLFVLKDAPYFGDENYYSESSDKLLNILLQLDNPHVRSLLIQRLVGNGYFMPFYSMILVPLKYFELSSSSIRLTYMLVNLLLSFVLVIQYRKYFGQRFAEILLSIFVLLPTLPLYDSTITPEALVAKFILFAVLLFYRLERSSVSWLKLALISLMLIAIVLFRQSAILLFLAFALWFLIQKGKLINIVSTIKKLTLILLPSTLVIIVAILCWSSLLVKKFGPGYLTTTSTDLSFMVLWGEGTEELGDQKYPSVWRRLNKYYLEKSREQGVTFKEVVKIDKKKVWKNLTVAGYFKGVKRNIKAFLDPSNVKIAYMFEKAGLKNQQMAVNALRKLNAVTCYFILLLIVVFLVMPRMIRVEYRKLLSLLIFIVPFLMVHIFVARANGRHGMIVWWPLTVIGSIVLSNLIRNAKQLKRDKFVKEPMSNAYAITVNMLRAFSIFLLAILLLGR